DGWCLLIFSVPSLLFSSHSITTSTSLFEHHSLSRGYTLHAKHHRHHRYHHHYYYYDYYYLLLSSSLLPLSLLLLIIVIITNYYHYFSTPVDIYVSSLSFLFLLLQSLAYPHFGFILDHGVTFSHKYASCWLLPKLF
ncbi:hypothetical protein WUBG_08413, partial [Wuchereria bancrofti]